ncbi:MAG: acyl-CoA thioesterase [Verrucomicrobia bacterium]|nr:acyl-CoA thioesterase [Verrucomicrobiota bacterium]
MDPSPPPSSVSPPSGPAVRLGRTRFETELQVRPDDIDLNQHVHASRYYDYVLAARYDQMARCYGMGMEEFLRAGYGWFTRTAHVEYKRPLRLGESMIVRTWVQEVVRDGVRVDFEILKKPHLKPACEGWFHFTMVSLQTGRALEIPDWVLAKYTI